MSDQSQSSSPPFSSSSLNYPCSCGLGDGTGQYIKCDNDDCPVAWYHWECVHVTQEPAGTWLCPKCSPNASFYIKQLVKRRAASPPLPKAAKGAASKLPKGKESRSTSAKTATATPVPAKDKAQTKEADTQNEDGKVVKKGVAIKKPTPKKPKPKFQGWEELPSDEEEEFKRKVDAQWAMEDAVVGKRKRSSRLAAEENQTNSHGLRPRVGGLRPRVEKTEVVKTDSSESSVGKESSDEDGSVYEEEVEEEEDEDEDEDEEESSVERKKSVTGIFSSDFSPDTNMEEDEDEEQSDYSEEENDSGNDEGKSQDEGSSLSSPPAIPQTPFVISISSTSPCSSSSYTMDVDGDISPRQSNKAGADSQTPSPSNRVVNDEEDNNDEDEHSAQPPAASPSDEDSEDYMDVVQNEHEHASSNESDSDYRPTSNSDHEDIVSVSSDTPTITPRSANRIDLTSLQGTPTSPSINILRDGDMETDESSEEHEAQAGTPTSPLVIILRSPYSSDEHEPEPGTPRSPSVVILRDREMATDESEHEDPVFVTVTPAVQFNPYAGQYPNRVEFLDDFPDSADRSTLPRLG